MLSVVRPGDRSFKVRARPTAGTSPTMHMHMTSAHAHAHGPLPPCTCPYAHAHGSMHMHVPMHMHMDLRTHAHTPAHSHACARAHLQALVHAPTCHASGADVARKADDGPVTCGRPRNTAAAALTDVSSPFRRDGGGDASAQGVARRVSVCASPAARAASHYLLASRTDVRARQQQHRPTPAYQPACATHAPSTRAGASPRLSTPCGSSRRSRRRCSSATSPSTKPPASWSSRLDSTPTTCSSPRTKRTSTPSSRRCSTSQLPSWATWRMPNLPPPPEGAARPKVHLDAFRRVILRGRRMQLATRLQVATRTQLATRLQLATRDRKSVV